MDLLCDICGKGSDLRFAGPGQVKTWEGGRRVHDDCFYAEIDAKDEAAVKAVSHGTPCFMRFGAPPPGGRSRNAAAGHLELGVSAFAAWDVGDRVVYDGRCSPGTALFGCDREAWVNYSATVVGTGSDGEPLVEGGEWQPAAVEVEPAA